MAQLSDTRSFKGDENVREAVKAATEKTRAGTDGLGFGPLIEERNLFASMPCEYVYPTAEGSANGAYLVFGRDRVGGDHPDQRSEGKKQYGDQVGHTGTAMIDLVVGRGVCLNDMNNPPRSEVEIEDEDGEKKFVPNRIDPDFVNDAARIYISQKSCIDEALELDEGKIGNPEGRSAIALKADGIRIVAREGIKIIADADTRISAAGQKKGVHQGINLIYGNTTQGKDYELHPMVKGKNLHSALVGLADMLGSLSSIVLDIHMILVEFVGAYSMHMHMGNMGGPTPMMPQDIPQSVKGLLTLLSDFSTKGIAFQTKQAGWKVNYCQPFGGQYICSKWNYVN